MFVPSKKASLTAILLVVAATATAQPPSLSSLIDCKQIQSDSERLACYDAYVSEFDTLAEIAPVAAPITASEKEDNFGKSDVKLSQKELKRKKEAQLKEITAKITKLERNTAGQLIVHLENGQVWRQSDSVNLRIDSARMASIKKAAMGSFRMKLDDGRRFRAKRLK